jgi:acyl dehydratase
MKFADLKPGMLIDCGTRKVSEEEILAYASKYDPQWFHLDLDRVRSGIWKGLISSGWLTCSIAMELVVKKILKGSEGVGSPGIETLRWPNPVRPDDVLGLVVKVLEARPSKSGKYGVVRWQWLLDNQVGERVLDLITTSLFDIPKIPP